MADVLILGAINSAIYAMLALGFTLIFGVGRVVNLAHGSFYAMGVYIAYTLVVVLGLPLLVGTAAAVLAVAAVGLAMDRVLIRPLRHSVLAVLIITVVFALLSEQVIFAFYGYTSRNIPSFTTTTLNVLGVTVAGQRAIAFAVGGIALGLVWLLVYRTRFGSAILAVAQDREAATYLGIDVEHVSRTVMVLSAALAATAGVLVAPVLVVSPQMWVLPLIKSFAVVILGGLGSIPGSLLASVLLGYSETAVSRFASSALSELVPLVLILVTLVVRPSGLLGRRIEL
ncbi:MAG TPA: branched-chain amino acid ABC transporter permease [bacterium]|nr:branched-chain amino acid ABC transporter permease [bacterium]